MKPGDIVPIFHKPITAQQCEGRARLIKKISNAGQFEGDQMELWEVIFTDDDYKLTRMIKGK